MTRRFVELARPRRSELALGIGDDCAVLRLSGDRDLLWTVDSLEEGVDFRRPWLTPAEIGARAVAAALSDVAGMAGSPLATLLALGSSRPAPAEELLELFEGAAHAARRWGAPVAGGDLTRRRRGIGITVTALGTVPRGKALRRSGARAGDELWVTGTLGAARIGVRLLERFGREQAERRNAVALERFVRPTPRLLEAIWLRDNARLHAALDLSDGLAPDLARLCAASGAGARIDYEALAVAAAESGARGLEDALYGGEDFELLFAARRGALETVAAEFSRRFGLPLTRLGRIVRGSRVLLRTARGEQPIARGGWDHVRPFKAVERSHGRLKP